MACVALSASAKERLPKQMVDPVLATSFEPARVHFEELPRTPAVRKEIEHASQYPLWIFASARDGDSTIYVVGGFEREYEDCDLPDSSKCPYAIEAGFGAVVRVRGKGVKFVGMPDAVMNSPESVVSKEVYEALWRDLARRFVQAFGSPAALSAELAKHDQSDLPPIAVTALREQGVDVPKKKPAAEK